MTEQGRTYVDFVGMQLVREHERRDRLDARGQAIITSSGAIVALAVALLAVVSGSDREAFSDRARDAALASIVLFVFAAAAGILTSFNFKYNVATGRTMAAMLTDHWTESEIAARNQCAWLDIQAIVTLRRGNNRKVRFLLGALIAQVMAIASLAAAIAIEFII